MSVKKLQPNFAVEISKDDLKTIDHRKFLYEHGVIFIRNIELTLDELENVAKCFGELQDISGKPSSTSLPTDSKYIRAMKYDGQPVDYPAGWFWHSEMSYSASRPSGGLLYMTEVPEVGGDTLFADQRTAYAQLSFRMKQHINRMGCVHEIGYWFKNKPEGGTHQQISDVHPETGERYLNVSDIFTTRIVGLPHVEGKHILAFLKEHATNDLWTHRHTWTKNCLAIWDDRLVQHKAIHNFDTQRTGYRIQLI